MNNKILRVAILAVWLIGGSKIFAQDKDFIPKRGRYYAYVGDTLISSFDGLAAPGSPYHSELFAGNVTHQREGNFERYTLTGGSVIFRSNKDKSEVARFTSERIVWYGPLDPLNPLE